MPPDSPSDSVPLSPPTLPQTADEGYVLELLARIEQNTRGIKRITNNHVHYYIDTSLTTTRKIDIIHDMGTPASELVVLDNGSGFTMDINGEGYPITSSLGFQVIDETISALYIVGSGTAGTGRIRIGLWIG